MGLRQVRTGAAAAPTGLRTARGEERIGWRKLLRSRLPARESPRLLDTRHLLPPRCVQKCLRLPDCRLHTAVAARPVSMSGKNCQACALTQTQFGILVGGGRLMLGTYQGIFLFEHRLSPPAAELVLHLNGQ